MPTTLPPVPGPVTVVVTPNPAEPVGYIHEEQVPFAKITPYQVAGLTPFTQTCCGTYTETFQRFGVAAFTSYTKNGITTALGGGYTVAQLDTLFASLGWTRSGDWYFIITDDVWSFDITYNPSLPAIDEPEFNALPCDDECREWCDEFKLPVFGVPNTNVSYENDFSPFLFNDPFHVSDDTSMSFYLQKYTGGIWSDVALLSGVDYGHDYPFGHFTSFPTYKGYGLNWGQVLLRQGEGCYRIRVQQSFTTTSEVKSTDTFTNTGLPVGDIVLGGVSLAIENDNVDAIDLKHKTLGETSTELETVLNNDSALSNEGLTFTVSRTDRTSPVNIIVESRKSNRVIGITANDVPPPSGGGGELPPWVYTGSVITTVTSIHYSCFLSDVFELKTFNCDRANRTVKFETWTEGKIGDKREDYLLHDYCGEKWYDSIRVPGLFGYPTVPEYKTVQLEWGNPYHGKVEQIRNEAVQAFTFKSLMIPQAIHERLSVYGMMADEVRVSDYNAANSDWEIKRMKVIRDSSYEAKPLIKEGSRKAVVEVGFKRQIQSVIKSICC